MKVKLQTKLPNIGSRKTASGGSNVLPEQQFRHAVELSKQTEQIRRQREIMLQAQYEAALRLEQIEKQTQQRIQEEARLRRIQQIKQDFANMRNKNKATLNQSPASKIPKLYAQCAKYTYQKPQNDKTSIPKRNVEELKKNTQIYRGIPDGKYRTPKPLSVLSQLQEVDANTVSFQEFCKVLKSECTDILRRLYDLLGPGGITIAQASQVLRIFKSLPRMYVQPASSPKRKSTNVNPPESLTKTLESAVPDVVQQPVIVAKLKSAESFYNTCINGVAARDRTQSDKIREIISVVALKLRDVQAQLSQQCFISLSVTNEELSASALVLFEFKKHFEMQVVPEGIRVMIQNHTDWRNRMDMFQERFADSLTHGLFSVLAQAVYQPDVQLFNTTTDQLAFVLGRCGMQIVEVQESSVIFKCNGELSQVWTDPVDFTQIAATAPRLDALITSKSVYSFVQGLRSELEHELLALGCADFSVQEAGHGICFVQAASLQAPSQTLQCKCENNSWRQECADNIYHAMRNLTSDESLLQAIVEGRPAMCQ